MGCDGVEERGSLLNCLRGNGGGAFGSSKKWVLAKDIVIRCGRSQVSWETMRMRMREGMYSLRGVEDRYVLRTKEGCVIA